MSDQVGANATFAASDDDSQDRTAARSVADMLERWMALSGETKLCVVVPRQRDLYYR